jgi:hypothetical protein
MTGVPAAELPAMYCGVAALLWCCAVLFWCVILFCFVPAVLFDIHPGKLVVATHMRAHVGWAWKGAGPRCGGVVVSP